MLPWPRVQDHLRQLLERARDQMDEAEGPDLWRLQGEARMLKRLLNLPHTLSLIDMKEEDDDSTQR